MTGRADRRIFFVGDSYVLGVGDPEHRGWVGRLAQRADRGGVPVTAYNLGVRRDTSDDIARRWAREVAVRRVAGAEERMVVSFGVNDTTVEGGAPRVPHGRSAANLRALVEKAAAAGLPVLFVGPAPVVDTEQNRRTEELDARLGACATELGTPYVTVFAALAGEPRWADEIARGDGAHPASFGYALLAELVAPPWERWVRGG